MRDPKFVILWRTESCKHPKRARAPQPPSAPGGPCVRNALQSTGMVFPWLWEEREPPGRRAAPSEPDFSNQEPVCVLDWDPARLGPCARCNLSSSSGPKCSPSAEVLAPRVWFGPSFHGKLNNHSRGRSGERARERKKTQKTNRTSTTLNSSSKSGKNQNTFWLPQA